ncbi:MAG: hypothetical protein ACKVW3_10120 [Phycisphaerales bacterium]
MTASARAGSGKSTPPPPGGDYDALADLFLGEGRCDETRRQGESRAAVIEQVVVGHLPVSAWAWVRQYARQAAEASGRGAALVRVEAGRVTIEVSGAGPDAGATGGAKDASIEAAVVRLAPRIGAWLLSVPDGGGLVGADAVTVLTGADEAAVVGSYRVLRDLVAPDAAAPVRMAIMGATPEKAGEASSRLSRAAEAFLNRPITLAAIVQRIASGSPATIALDAPLTGDVAGEARRIVGLIRGVATRADGGGATGRGKDPAEHRADGRQSDHRGGWIGETNEHRVGAVAKYAVAMRHVREAVTEEAKGDTRSPHTGAAGPARHAEELAHDARGHAASAGGSAVRDSRGTEARAGDTSAAALLDLTRLAMACPAAMGVDLAVDQAGELHIATLAAASGDRAVVDVLAAADWARANSAVVSLALRALGLTTEVRTPTMHVLTEDAADARRLAVAGIRVHLVVRLDVEGRQIRRVVAL